MEIAERTYNKQEFIETAHGNKVCRQSTLCGSQNIMLTGKTILMPNCVIRGDLANVRVGRYCFLGERAILRPSYKKFSKGAAFCPVHIGDHVYIDEGAIVFAASIGSYTHIGKNAVIGKRCILRECCAVLDDAVLAADTVVPPFAIMAGRPAKIVGELPYCTQELMTDATKSVFEKFKPVTSNV